jgi:hypothetical protein
MKMTLQYALKEGIIDIYHTKDGTLGIVGPKDQLIHFDNQKNVIVWWGESYPIQEVEHLFIQGEVGNGEQLEKRRHQHAIWDIEKPKIKLTLWDRIKLLYLRHHKKD